MRRPTKKLPRRLAKFFDSTRVFCEMSTTVWYHPHDVDALAKDDIRLRCNKSGVYELMVWKDYRWVTAVSSAHHTMDDFIATMTTWLLTGEL